MTQKDKRIMNIIAIFIFVMAISLGNVRANSQAKGIEDKKREVFYREVTWTEGLIKGTYDLKELNLRGGFDKTVNSVIPSYEGFEIDTTKTNIENTKKITKDINGMTVVNLYYKRKQYTLNVYEIKDGKSEKKISTKLDYGKSTFDTLNSFSNEGYSIYSNKDINSKNQYKAYPIIVKDTDIYIVKENNKTKYTIAYQDEVGNIIHKGSSFYGENKENLASKDALQIPGYIAENVNQWQQPNSQNGNKATIKYKKKKFKVKFVSFMTESINVTYDRYIEVEFDDFLSNFYNKTELQKGQKFTTKNGDVFRFDGWYKESDYAGEEYSFSDQEKMPANDLVFFAKWIKESKDSNSKPNVPKPNVPKPNAPKPNVPKPNVPKPNVPKPNAPKPNVPKPNVPKPNVPKPNVPKPNVPKPEENKEYIRNKALWSKINKIEIKDSFINIKTDKEKSFELEFYDKLNKKLDINMIIFDLMNVYNPKKEFVGQNIIDGDQNLDKQTVLDIRIEDDKIMTGEYTFMINVQVETGKYKSFEVKINLLNNFGWVNENGNWYYYSEYGNKVVSEWKWTPILDDNNEETGEYNWKYFDSKGVNIAQIYTEKGSSWLSQVGPTKSYYKGWWINPENNQRYFFRMSSGSMVTGRQFIENNWMYFRKSGTVAKGWQYFNGSWNYLDNNTGFQAISKWIWAPVLDKSGKETGKYNWKYFNSMGASITQFYTQKGSSWLSQAGPSTQYHRGWWINPENGQRYYFRKESGSMVRGEQFIDNGWRYFRNSGTVATGWQKISSVWKYFDKNSGVRVSGKQFIDGKWYRFKMDGSLIGNR